MSAVAGVDPRREQARARVLEPQLPADPARRLRWVRLPGLAKALAIAQTARRATGPVFVVAADPRAAEQLVGELRFFLTDESTLPVGVFPDWETLPYDQFSPYQDIISERLAVLAGLRDLARGVVVVAATTVMHRLPPPRFIAGASFLLEAGTVLDRARFQHRLEDAGYRRVGQVIEHGDYALRGALIDVFPMGAPHPFRLDLFGDDIESIRIFDPETQRSLTQVPRLEILPAREFPLDDEAIAGFRRRWREQFEGNPARCTMYADVSNKIAPAGIEYYLPLFFEHTASLFDYMPQGALVILDAGSLAQVEHFEQEVAARYERVRHDVQRPVLPPDRVFFDRAWLTKELARCSHIEIGDVTAHGTAGVVEFAAEPAIPIPVDARAREPLAELQRFLATTSARVLFVVESAGRRETLLELLRAHHLDLPVVDGWTAFLEGTAPVALAVAPLERGMRLTDPDLTVVTETQLFGERVAQRRRRRVGGRDAEAIVRNLTELAVGSPVVHEQHGVGRYLGLTTLNVNGISGEFLHLEYADGDKLYVPVGSLALVSRYTGPDPEHAPLEKLGSGAWQKARERAAARVRDVAAELLDLHARRAARQGHRFILDADAYRGFAAAFPFEETPDQEAAIAAVLADMQAPQPMDRVVCGDSGFGKTEVAMRAAFVAAMGGRQVAVLVPTTLLAQQHLQNFKDRFADWPVRIEQLSRFRSKKEQDVVLAGIEAGGVDIVIGTHKLIGGALKFARLGLLIIDEEHRFGVRQKELLKALRADVDILTLTATPIPRTLNMSLSGVRDLSLIATAPSRRVPVKTFVRGWDDELVREALLREINRGGQVYFIHNELETIEQMTDTLGRLLPEARVRYAHGQMRERDLERAMLDFYHKRFNVLVCSTIIETGIDVPSANTILINRADRFGLAQLYQLRGRVGRSHHRAYAYLLVPDRRAMTADALKRLEAIEALEELGIGFTLATHDLEIRGAGELLGEEQSGHIQAIGYGLYMELLQRAVSALRSGREPALDKPLHSGPEIELGIPALIPEDYLPDVHGRLVFYKRIANAASAEELEDLAAEMIDRFGLLPAQAHNLFRIAGLRLRAQAIGMRRIDLGAAGGRIQFEPDARVDGAAIVKLIQAQAEAYRLDGRDKLRVRKLLPDGAARIAEIERLMSLLKLEAKA